MTLTPDEERKLHVLTLLEGKRISLGQAAEALGLTPRQVRRLRVGLRRKGPPPSSMATGRGARRIDSRSPSGLRSSPSPAGGMPGSTMSTSPRSSPRSRASR